MRSRSTMADAYPARAPKPSPLDAPMLPVAVKWLSNEHVIYRSRAETLGIIREQAPEG